MSGKLDTTSKMLASDHKVVSREEWLNARKAHLEKEKAFDKERDQLSVERRDLPWVKVEKDYIFENLDGSKQSLSDLFDGRSQLIVYHFMFGADWDAGCLACCFLADHFDGMRQHLPHRDISFVAISTAAPVKVKSFRERMGWSFNWLSTAPEGNTFNQDYHVTFSKEDLANKNVTYNYKANISYGSTEGPGISVFAKDEETGHVYHTYSTYGRGLDKLVGAYHFIDMVPKGRDESGLPWSMAWVRRHDEYDAN